MSTIIFVTDLSLWSLGKNRGGQAFTKTIEGYVTSGFNVWLISDVMSNADYPVLDNSRNIVIKPSWFKQYVLKRKIGVVFKYLDHVFTTRKIKREIGKIIDSCDDDICLYAYEIFGVKACASEKKKYMERNIKTISRFQGTILASHSFTILDRIKEYPHYAALEESADLVIMTNDGTQGDEVLKKIGNKSNTLFLLNGLDLMEKDLDEFKSGFNRLRFRKDLFPDIEENECIFLTVSRLEGWKRLDRSIDGFADFCTMNNKGKLCVVGDGTERVALEERVKEKNIRERVKFVGAVPHDEVYNYLISADVFLSLYDLSNVGNPLLEAMALGRCIITYDVGDTKRFITNGKNGLLLSASELPKLGSVMANLAEDENMRERLGRSASDYAKTHFWDWKHRMQYEIDEVRKIMNQQ